MADSVLDQFSGYIGQRAKFSTHSGVYKGTLKEVQLGHDNILKFVITKAKRRSFLGWFSCDDQIWSTDQAIAALRRKGTVLTVSGTIGELLLGN